MFWGFATCKSVIRDAVELFRAKSRCEDTFFETENWQTLSKMPYSQEKKKNPTNSAAAGVFTMKLIMIKNCYLHKNDTSRFFVSNVSIGFHQRELCNEHSQVETQGVNSLLRSF